MFGFRLQLVARAQIVSTGSFECVVPFFGNVHVDAVLRNARLDECVGPLRGDRVVGGDYEGGFPGKAAGLANEIAENAGHHGLNRFL